MVDAPHKDLRRARSAMLSLQPTTTGSATAIALIYPELKGKLNGHAVRAPVLNASLTDCVFELKRDDHGRGGQRAVRKLRPRGRSPAFSAMRRARWSRPTTTMTRAARSSMPEHDGHRRHVAEGLRLVRQRGRLCLPHGRPGQHRHERGSLMPCFAITRSSPRPTGASRWSTARCACWCCCISSSSATRPFTLAFLFLLYEFAGIVANLGGGWLATRFGIPRMLAVGQALQIAGLLMLSALDPAGARPASVAWVVAAQGIAGIAKDVTKTASKSAIKATSADGNSQLFRWVAWFTGSKNAMKGVGFFLGGLLLETMGFRDALWLMAGLLAVILVAGLRFAARAARQSRSVEVGERAVRQVARRQPAGGGTHLSVRRARCLVCRRLAGLPLCGRLALP